MDPVVEAILEKVERLDPSILGRFTLGLCEHFVYAGDVLHGGERFRETLMRLWEWHLGVIGPDPDDLVANLLKTLPEMDPDAESNLRDETIVGTYVLLEQSYCTLRGERRMGKVVLSTSCDQMVAYAALLGMDTACAGGLPISDLVKSYPPFCQDYFGRLEQMLNSLPKAGLAEIGEWRIEQQRWGEALRDRLVKALEMREAEEW